MIALRVRLRAALVVTSSLAACAQIAGLGDPPTLAPEDAGWDGSSPEGSSAQGDAGRDATLEDVTGDDVSDVTTGDASDAEAGALTDASDAGDATWPVAAGRRNAIAVTRTTPRRR